MLKKINLENFKIHQNSEIYFDEMLSILTGENNSGKTSLLESLLIFQECYNATLHKISTRNSNNVKNNVLKVGDYDFKSKFIQSFNSVRSEDYYELFFKDSDAFFISLTLNIEDQTIVLPFKISKARNSTVYNIESTIDSESLRLLNSYNPLKLIFFVKSSPIFNIVRNEPYYTPKILEKYMFENANLSIMRNRLLKLKQDNKMLELQGQIAYIMGFKEFTLDVKYDINTDVYIDVKFKADFTDEYQDIAMLGSGTLQIMEVLISLNMTNEYKLRIALLDEPDSHRHRKLQLNLIEKLREISQNNIQIFLTTHNEQLISNAKLSEVIHLYQNTKALMIAKPIQPAIEQGRQIGFLNTIDKNKIYTSLGISSSVMNILESIESDRVVLIEGKSDAMYIQALQQRRKSMYATSSEKKVSFWSINGIDDLPNKLKYWKQILEKISNEKTIWDKSILVLDSDSLTLDEKSILKEEIKKSFAIETYFWDTYTIETILLENVEVFSKTFSQLFNVDVNTVNNIVNTEISNVKIENFTKKINGQRKSRAKTYEFFSNQKLKLYDGDNHSEFLKYIENMPNKALGLFGKEEVFIILDKLFNSFDIEVEDEKEDILLNIFLNFQQLQPNWISILKKIYE